MTKTNSKTSLPAGCGDLTRNVQDNGGPLDPTVASTYIKNYLAGVNDPTATNHNYGYLFGLNKVTDFLTQITNYNATKPAKLIEGVRVYLGRQAQATANLPMEKIMDTLFLIPVFSDGSDFPQVHQVDGATIILGDPRPCPTLCLLLSFSQE
jgi:hypothetical protein